MKIAVDAMGGDYAPQVVVGGAIAAVEEHGVEVVLVGRRDEIERELKRYKNLPAGISIEHASEVIDMNEPATSSIRKKRDSSITKATELLNEKKVDAMVSAGNTGAVVCAATFILKMLPNIERPGIAIIMPTLKGTTLIMDVGANIDVKPSHLLHYGLMADAYARTVLKKNTPSVGLLNIGEEQSKGTGVVKEAHVLMESAKFNFIGNVEGRELFSGNCDCIITDGVVGNVALKVSESLAEVLMQLFKREILSDFWGKLGILLMQGSLKRLKKSMDYSEYGGAPLLGVNGIVIIGHGRSTAKAIKNAIRAAKKEVEGKINEAIVEEIASA
ncbi:phosphate acyltransferase PlsX [Candidatus Omnitrophota bacterium]